MSLRSLRKAFAKSSGAMLVVYAFFSIFPHFATVTHTHAGGNASHTHAALSAHDAALERAVLENLGAAAGFGDASPPAEPKPGETARWTPLGRGDLGLGPANLRHAHYQQDPNLLALGVALAFALSVLASRRIPPPPSTRPPRSAPPRTLARGPPVVFAS